jgi:membrane-associated phospholipid phosphatase
MMRYLSKKKLSIIDVLNTAFIFVVLIFYIFSLPRNVYGAWPLVVIAAALALVWAAVRLRHNASVAAPKTFIARMGKVYLDFYPLLFMFVIFESFFMILPYFNPHDYDPELAQLDFRLFGVNPTVWIEQWVRPWLTDLLYLVYFTYYPFPLFILIYLYRKKKFTELDRSIFLLLVVNYGAYVIYFFVPAMGPRYYEPIMQLQTKSLHGVFLAVPIREIIHFFEPNKFDAFPSLHAATTLTTLVIMAKYNKKMFLIFIPLFLGILVAVIYCRFHYVMDVFAGIVWTIVAVVVAGFIYDRYAKNRFIPYCVSHENV